MSDMPMLAVNPIKGDNLGKTIDILHMKEGLRPAKTCRQQRISKHAGTEK